MLRCKVASKHFNAASSRTITECRCAAGTQIYFYCSLMVQVFACISRCMQKYCGVLSVARLVPPPTNASASHDWEGGCAALRYACVCFSALLPPLGGALSKSTPPLTPSRHCGGRGESRQLTRPKQKG